MVPDRTDYSFSGGTESVYPHLLAEEVRSLRETSGEEGCTLRDIEREVIRSALEKAGNNKSLTAKRLGIARQTLLNKIKDYQLE